MLTISTVTARATSEMMEEDPFPHLIVENAINDELFRQLKDFLPSFETLSKGLSPGSNQRMNFSALNIAYHPNINCIWRDFIGAHLSQGFLNEVLNLLGPSIKKIYPDFEREFGQLDQLRAGIRHADDFRTADILLDAQIALNTPVSVPSPTVRGPHLDNPNKLFVGLFYIRPDGDNAEGGELELYLPRESSPVYAPKRLLNKEDVLFVKRIPYKNNVLVLFPNSPQALHGVSPRALSTTPRYFLNLLGEVSRPLFGVPIREDSEVKSTHERTVSLLSRFFTIKGPKK